MWISTSRRGSFVKNGIAFKFRLVSERGLGYEPEMDDLQPLLAKFDERKQRRERERFALNKRLVELNAEAERDEVTVNNLIAICSEHHKDYVPNLTIPDAVEPAPPPPTAAAVQMASNGMRVKDMVLAVVRDAYPQGLTAKQIKGKAFLRYKHDINPNTLTVTLVRYSKGNEARVRCDGRTWYYVPQKANGAAVSERKRYDPDIEALL